MQKFINGSVSTAKRGQMEKEFSFNSDLLYAVAKELFLEKGYKNTTFSDLAERANVHKSLITYYFKTKYNLAMNIIREYVSTYTAAVIDTLKKYSKEDDPLCESILRNMVLFHGLDQNRNVARFYIEFIDASGPHLYSSLKRTLLEKIKNKINIPMTEKQLKFIQMVDDSSRESLIKSYFEDHTDLTLEEAIEMKSKLVFQMFGMSDEVIELIYQDSKTMFDNTKYTFGPGIYIHVEK